MIVFWPNSEWAGFETVSTKLKTEKKNTYL